LYSYLQGLFPGDRFSHCFLLFDSTLSELPGPEYFGGLSAFALGVIDMVAAKTPVSNALMANIANSL
jgi:hypothetical protein